jgi:hypothetical protein
MRADVAQRVGTADDAGRVDRQGQDRVQQRGQVVVVHRSSTFRGWFAAEGVRMICGRPPASSTGLINSAAAAYQRTSSRDDQELTG